MERRNFLIGMGAASAGGGIVLGSGAFSRVESDRYMQIEVAEDPDAYLGLDACDSAHGDNYVEIDDHGHLYVDISENPNGGEGVNSDSRTWFDDVFQVCNQGKEDAHVYIEHGEGWPTVSAGEHEGEPRVDFYVGEDQASILGADNALELELGECHCVGIKTNTHGLDATNTETLLEAIDDTVTIVARADEPDEVPPEMAFFEVTDIDPSAISVEPGEHFDISATITNTGDAAGEQIVELLIDGDVVDDYPLSLEPDDDETIAFEAVPTGDLDVGEYELLVRTDDDENWITLDVGEPVDDPPAYPLRDLSYAYYEGVGSDFPDFDELDPVETGTPPEGVISLAPRQQESDYGLVFEGTIAVGDRMEPGEYTFVVESDPGSRLLIGGETVLDSTDGSNDEEASVDLEAGTHEFRLEYADPDGTQMLAIGWTDPYGELLFRIAADDPLRTGQPFDWELDVGERPASKQIWMPDSSVRSIAVGVWPNTNYCFDTTTAAVQYGWRGAFLDYGPMVSYRSGRGNNPGNVLGTAFDVGGVDYPLRFGSAADEPAVEFLGYREAPLPPELHYTVDGHEVTQTVDLVSNAIGLEYTIEIDDPPNEPIYFLTDADADIERSATVGTWDDGVLEVPAGETEIGITITANGGEL